MAWLAIIVFILLLLALAWGHYRKLTFNVQVLASLVVGILFGFAVQNMVQHNPAHVHIIDQAFQLVGSAYLSLLTMLVVPLILTSIVHAIMNLGDACGKLLGQLAFRSVGMLLILTGLASAIGMAVGVWFHVGQGMKLPLQGMIPTHPVSSFIDTLLGFLPNNPVAVMANGNTIAMVIFAVLLGLAGLLLRRQAPEQAEPFQRFMTSAFMVMKKLVSIVIGLTPYGVLALMAHATATQGWQTLSGLLDFLGAMYVAMLFVWVMHTVILFAIGKNPITHYKQVYAALLVAFTTRSSFGTLPVTEEVLSTRANVRQMTATFVPSMGATMGMNACAGVFPAMLVVMAMTILHHPITGITFVIIMFVNAFASLGISGIPGTAFIAATVSLTTLGLPYSVVGLVQGIDPIVDMGRTATNVNGVLTTAVTVDKSLSKSA